MVCLAKLYDMVLSARFQLWYKPKVEQAGAQPGRGCEEQILTIRLLIEIARKCNKTLYIAFVDYKKAYDKVMRSKLVSMLHAKGCGTLFLKALVASFNQSSGVIGNDSFKTSAGVRQGASSSCPLFTFFIDATVDAIAADGPDGWLEELHSLLLMDDTAVFATSRKSMEKKLKRLKKCTDDIGMVMHPTKSRFIAINATDLRPFVLDEVSISHTSEYVYLGTIISVKSIAEQVIAHLKMKTGNVMKFFTFLAKNTDAPFYVKHTVWDSAIVSSIFYSSETWLTSNLKAAETVYISTVKNLLGVRGTTLKEIALLEAGVCDAKAYIRERQRRFFQKLMLRPDYDTSYIGRVVSMAIAHKTTAGCVIKSVMHKSSDISENSFRDLRSNVREKATSRRIQYLRVNPNLSVSYAYERQSRIPEHYRIAYTRIKLMSHRLRVETGRWSRLDYDQRTCSCGEVQTEEHVLMNCPQTLGLRNTCPPTMHFTSIDALLCLNSENAIDVCKYCFEVLRKMS